jgi:hypothetical protein
MRWGHSWNIATHCHDSIFGTIMNSINDCPMTRRQFWPVSVQSDTPLGTNT